jgi:cyclohexanone monooxygenase
MIEAGMAQSNRRPVVGIIGAGPGGIAMGIQLAQQGYDFVILECSDGFGGTWRKNTYPGAACDVPSHFYSFSFALNPYWSKIFEGKHDRNDVAVVRHRRPMDGRDVAG